ncbi:MAG: hypothetical protein WCL48_04595 [Betaproteobacteria bacterium]|jgi:hypothetical protein
MLLQLFKQGLLDAIGFLIGTALGYGLGQLLSIDLFAPGYSMMSLLGIALIGIGGGMGLQASRYLWQRDKKSET